MTRLSKQTRKRAVSPRRRPAPSEKTGPRKESLPKGFKEHANAVAGPLSTSTFIPKIK